MPNLKKKTFEIMPSTKPITVAKKPVFASDKLVKKVKEPYVPKRSESPPSFEF